jgi:CDP-paratose 2-epimerase
MIYNEYKFLVTGGAGFIGANLAARLIQNGAKVTVLDNLSRPGAEANIEWLTNLSKNGHLTIITGDINDFSKLSQACKGVTCIFHFAGQVAVTTSVSDPKKDFLDNALGTLNVLEAARASGCEPIVVYSSTNKVYGGMDDIEFEECATRYEYKTQTAGIPESQPLDFHSPYGCSKGAADQYVRDYSRIYGLKTIVMRQSCIYGYRQFGIEDQGWLAWFIIAALKERPITIYGNGKQVRDILFIDDLLDAYESAVAQIQNTSGKIYNVGGGAKNTISVWTEFAPILESLLGRPIKVTIKDWRPGDQKIYVSDIRAAKLDFGWGPKVGIEEGITRLFNWMKSNRDLFADL